MHCIRLPNIVATADALQEMSPGDATGAETLPAAVLATLAVAALATLAARPSWRRLPSEPSGAAPRDPALGLAAMLAFVVAGSAGALLAAAFIPSDAADSPFARLGRGAAMNLAQVALAVVAIRSPLFVAGPRAPVPWRRAAAEGAVGFALVLPIVATLALAVNAAATALGLPPAPEASHETLAILRREANPLLTALTLAHVAVLVPFAEEAGWRGLLHPTIRSFARPWPACLLSGALFTAIHWSVIPPEGRPAGLAMLLALGVALGALRERTGGILAPAVLHGLFNAANVALALA